MTYYVFSNNYKKTGHKNAINARKAAFTAAVYFGGTVYITEDDSGKEKAYASVKAYAQSKNPKTTADYVVKLVGASGKTYRLYKSGSVSRM